MKLLLIAALIAISCSQLIEGNPTNIASLKIAKRRMCECYSYWGQPYSLQVMCTQKKKEIGPVECDRDSHCHHKYGRGSECVESFHSEATTERQTDTHMSTLTTSKWSKSSEELTESTNNDTLTLAMWIIVLTFLAVIIVAMFAVLKRTFCVGHSRNLVRPRPDNSVQTRIYPNLATLTAASSSSSIQDTSIEPPTSRDPPPSYEVALYQSSVVQFVSPHYPSFVETPPTASQLKD